MERSVAMIFPPNWSCCVSGPHLAAPLLAGVALAQNWACMSLDLTQEFCASMARPPVSHDIVDAAQGEKFEALDELYFAWEDGIHERAKGCGTANFGLLSGFGFGELEKLPLAEAARSIAECGTIFDEFYRTSAVTRLRSAQCSVVGVSIASRSQVLPALRLLQILRQELPHVFILLGGNVVTRLRTSAAFDTFIAHADQIVIFQGDLAFAQTLDAISQFGVESARCGLSRIAGDQTVPPAKWPLPAYETVSFENYVGRASLSYVSTRGCYWGKCSFCAIPAGWSESGYAGTASAAAVAAQLVQMARRTGIPRIKFVDEALSPAKAKLLGSYLKSCQPPIEWEAYCRLEQAWEDVGLLEHARAGGLRKLYFGLEQAPTTNRAILNKNDRGDIEKIMSACAKVGVKVHLFCMVGHPHSSPQDAWATTNYLIENRELIDTADLSGFRFDKGTSVSGIIPAPGASCDWDLSLKYVPVDSTTMTSEEVATIELECQEAIWQKTPRLLHPLYRVVGPWDFLTPRYANSRQKIEHYDVESIDC